MKDAKKIYQQIQKDLVKQKTRNRQTIVQGRTTHDR